MYIRKRKEMIMLKLEIKNKSGEILKSAEGNDIELVYSEVYNEGDYISITSPDSKYLVTQLDPELKECMIYVPSQMMDYAIPFGEKLNAYGQKAFAGESHIIKVWYASDEEIYSYRNVAINSADKRGIDVCYPHAVADYVTRDEAGFEERNTIDGYTNTDGHGNFPYQSWGCGPREDTDYKLYFGRPVEIDKLVLYLRADYVNDHDINWKSMTIELSDGTVIPAEFEKTGEAQTIELDGKKIVEWIHLTDFKQPVTPLKFAALTQIEVYGNDVKN